MKNLNNEIHKSILLYIAGSFCFVIFALASIVFGFYIVLNYGEHNFSIRLLMLSFAGGLLLWEIVKSFKIKARIPDTYRYITYQEYPKLFDLIAEVTRNLNLSPIKDVYLCADATAAVFIQPQLRNILFEPKRYLVIGLGFLTQMDDDEIRAVLYHEFGHYVQSEMKYSLSVYTIGQFSRTFISVKEMKTDSVWQQQYKFQLLLFTYFTLWACKRINKYYKQLIKQMEYNADDVAIKYIERSTLQRALIHAACIRYNYKVMQWGIKQLEIQNIQVDSIYTALSLIGCYSRPSRKLLSDEVVKRVERLGKLENWDYGKSTYNIREYAMLIAKSQYCKKQVCSAVQFAQWLRQGFDVYIKQRQFERSVILEIHLDNKKHKLPWLEVTYNILLDGKELCVGNFVKGYTIIRKISPGTHIISVYAPSGIISTPFEFNVEAYNKYKIEMNYKYYFTKGVYDVFAEKINIA